MQSHSNDSEQPAHLKNLASNDPFLEALTELLPVCLFAKDMEGRYLYVNDSFAAKTRLKDKALIVGKRASDVLEPDHAAIAQKEDQEILQSGQSILNRENHIRGLAQTKNCEIISKVCVYDPAGKQLGIAGITLDITERKRNETQLRELNEQLDLQNKRYEEELSLGRQVQKTFVKVKPVESETSLDIGHFYQPSAQLSGDLIIAEPIDEQHLAILICDVMGHGIRSALVTGILRSFYDEHKALIVDPAAFVTRLNKQYNALLSDLDSTLFTTLSCGVLNHRTGEMKLTSAGHHDPIWFRPVTGEFVMENEQILTPNPAIGLIDGITFETTTHTLNEGDVILFYTDGLIEASCENEEEFGVEPIRRILKTQANEKNSQALIDTIVDEVHAFADKIDDDISVLMLKKNLYMR